MTLVAAAELPDGEVLRPTIAVIGSGPAGLTVALDLAAAGVDVVVVESGGLEPDEVSRDASDGDVVGQPLRFARQPVSLADVRLRALGGSSGHWSGLCRPLDPIDVGPRPDLGRPGWPIELDELRPDYDAAAATLQLGSSDFDVGRWFESRGEPVPLDTDAATTALYRFSAPTQFGTRFRPTLDSSDRLTAILNATVVELVTDRRAERVTRVAAVGPTGGRIFIEAEYVVVATGGIDVPRLLLSSPVGTTRDLVGRGFMEHPHVRLGYLAVDLEPDAAAALRPHRGAGAQESERAWAAFTLRPEAILEHGLLNAALALDPRSVELAPDGDDLRPGVAEIVGRRAAPTIGSATLRCEQLPLEEHRVVLGRRRDAFGLRRPELRWTIDQATMRSLEATAVALAGELGRQGLGRLQVTVGGGQIERSLIEAGCHHMGTARMAADPATGVVDRDGLVFGTENVFVAGSAVFPTSGYANPTLTIVALAHRLARHLGEIAGVAVGAVTGPS